MPTDAAWAVVAAIDATSATGNQNDFIILFISLLSLSDYSGVYQIGEV
jgi:hypothetical protein